MTSHQKQNWVLKVNKMTSHKKKTKSSFKCNQNDIPLKRQNEVRMETRPEKEAILSHVEGGCYKNRRTRYSFRYCLVIFNTALCKYNIIKCWQVNKRILISITNTPLHRIVNIHQNNLWINTKQTQKYFSKQNVTKRTIHLTQKSN